MLKITDGNYRDIHSRIYVHVNPNRYEGPWTWRLSNLQPYTDEPLGIDIFTILPIDDTRTVDGDNVNLFFNIEELADVSEARTISQSASSRTHVTVYGVTEGLKKLTNLTAIKPVQTTEFGDKIGIYFDINSLDSVVTRKNKLNVNSFNYNNKSIDNLTADKPLEVSAADESSAIVSFDIRQLDHA